MTHYAKNQGTSDIKLGTEEEQPTLKPITETGTGSPYEKTKERLSELIQKLNDLFEGELTDADKIAYVQHIVGKMMENKTLAKQAEQSLERPVRARRFQGRIHGHGDWRPGQLQVDGFTSVRQREGKAKVC